MKYIILLVIGMMGLFISSCKKNQPAPPSYTVEGTVDSALNGKKAYLYDYNIKRNIDSILVDSNKFVFKGVVDTVRFCRVQLERNYANLILDTGRIVINWENHNASGSPLNAAYVNFVKEMREYYEESFSIYNDLKEKIKDKTLLMKAVDSISNKIWMPKYNAFMDKSLEANANNILGAIILEEMSRSYRTAQMDTAIAKLDKNIASLSMVNLVVDTNEKLKKTAVGQKFVDFTIDQPDGKKVSLSDYAGKGKYLLVDFWASWCGPCRGETPNLKELYKKYKGDKFEILGVVVWDNVENTKKAIEEDQTTWPQILDAKEIPTKLYGIRGIPHIILIGPDGTIVARDLRGDAMKAKVAEVLSK